MEEIYYEKILVSTGEVPEKEGWQDTNRGPVQWANGIWQLSRNNIIPVTYFYKSVSVPSPKQEAVEFAMLVGRNILKALNIPLTGDFELEKLSELYDKFKEKGEK